MRTYTVEPGYDLLENPHWVLFVHTTRGKTAIEWFDTEREAYRALARKNSKPQIIPCNPFAPSTYKGKLRLIA